MNILDFLKENILVLDGGMGTLLQARGLMPGELPERWVLSHPDVIRNIHKEYYDGGSNVVSANTFGANSLKFSEEELEEIIANAIRLAGEAASASGNTGEKWVALDIGPLGVMLKPYGNMDFDEAVSVFATTVRLGEKHGADLIFIETMNDSYETKAALLAAKENSSLPVFVSNAYSADGRLMSGTPPRAMVAMLEGLGADAIGVNCSLGPAALMPVVSEYVKYSSLPILMKPNAGLPRVIDDKTVYDVSADDFARSIASAVELGVGIVGGCCGTTPEYIEKTKKALSGLKTPDICKKDFTIISSFARAVEFSDEPILIGERINPTGKKRLKEALRSNDIQYILREAISQEELGVHVLDVNVGLPEIDEAEMLRRAVFEIQAVCPLPLQLDSSDKRAMEAALRIYNGKAMINSVNGKRQSMEEIFPLVKKYGGLVVALTLDENGIPDTAEKRLEIAERILKCAEEYGIDKKDIIFDPLALTVSTDRRAAKETLRAVSMIKKQLGVKCSLGVSNISFGLPARDIINGSFFTMALSAGLSCAIMNPHSAEMMRAYHAYLALAGYDDNFSRYIEFAERIPAEAMIKPDEKKQEKRNNAPELSSLGEAIYKGLREAAAGITAELLSARKPLDIIENEIIPALNAVGVDYENKAVYLPGLLMSAEAASSAFAKIKESVDTTGAGRRCKIVLATVRGDIHDIGKNIVKLLLENFGFSVIDLGRDVAPETIVDAVIENKAPLLGLSALMTTTVVSMEETIKLLRVRAPFCKCVVGGAVLTAEYADKIGADKYAPDAMDTVRYAEQIDREQNRK